MEAHLYMIREDFLQHIEQTQWMPYLHITMRWWYMSRIFLPLHQTHTTQKPADSWVYTRTSPFFSHIFLLWSFFLSLIFTRSFLLSSTDASPVSPLLPWFCTAGRVRRVFLYGCLFLCDAREHIVFTASWRPRQTPHIYWWFCSIKEIYMKKKKEENSRRGGGGGQCA